MSTIRIGIVGTRSRNTQKDLDYLIEFIKPILFEYDLDRWKIEFVSGGCPKGADRFAEILAQGFGIPIKIHYPNKDNLPDEPTRWDFRNEAFARNTLIAEDSDILIAMVAPDRLGGTEDCVKKYINLGKKNLYLI